MDKKKRDPETQTKTEVPLLLVLGLALGALSVGLPGIHDPVRIMIAVGTTLCFLRAAVLGSQLLGAEVVDQKEKR